MPASPAEPKIAVLVPCYNEAATIAKVVRDFRGVLPRAQIYVGDNNSSDGSGALAAEAGAYVVRILRQGKGAVVRQLFRTVEADLYVLVDADDTYPAEAVHELLEPIIAGRADMTVGDRRSGGYYAEENTRRWHEFGNQLVTGSVNLLFAAHLCDIMSGYRAFSRRFVKNFAVLNDGFELETALSLHALDRRFSIVELPIAYHDRPPGSSSKLSTYADGFRVLRTIVWVFKDCKPLIFFLSAAALLFCLALVSFASLLMSRVHWAFLALCGVLLAVGGMLCLVCGFILDTLVKQHRESYELTLNAAEPERLDDET
jgi:glycosyltransferase involved in cell wall biosynthesis